MDSWLVFRRDRIILNQWTKRNDWPFSMVLQNAFRTEYSHQTRDRECFADRFSIPWNLPTNFHLDLIATYSRGAFLYSAYCSLSKPICFRSAWCRRTIIPGEIFTGFAKFQGIVSVNDFRLPIWLQELLQAPLCFLRSFCFARDTTRSIGWPSPAPRLHIDDCIEIHNLHWELCDLL